MKYRTLALIAALLFASIAVAKEKHVIVTTDKFTGKTTVTMSMFGIENDARIVGAPSLSLFAQEKDGSIVLVIASSAPDWTFPRGADVKVLADGKPIDLGHFKQGDGKVGTFMSVVSVEENVAATVDRAAFEQMAASRDLEIEVGQFPCKVRSKDIVRLKEFADATRQITASK